MGLDLGEFEAAAVRPGGICWWRLLDFTDDQRAKLDEVLFRRPDIASSSIARVLKAWGYAVSGQSLRRHRARECGCGKS